MELRPTTVGDVEALHALFLESIASVYRPHAFEPPAPPLEVFANQQVHLVETGTSVVAEHAGSIAGFVASWTRESDWFLASLFVASAAHDRGVGSALLRAVWCDAARRRTITDAIQPVSNALYARHGLVPATPVIAFAGLPSIAAPVEPCDADVGAVDRAAYGFDRTVDHAYWAKHGVRTTWPDAYAYVFPGGAIGPVAGVSPDAAAAALAGELARSTGSVRVRIPGSARGLVEVALAAGLTLEAPPGLLLLSGGVGVPDRLAVGSYTLY